MEPWIDVLQRALHYHCRVGVECLRDELAAGGHHLCAGCTTQRDPNGRLRCCPMAFPFLASRQARTEAEVLEEFGALCASMPDETTRIGGYPATLLRHFVQFWDWSDRDGKRAEAVKAMLAVVEQHLATRERD